MERVTNSIVNATFVFIEDRLELAAYDVGEDQCMQGRG